MMKPFLYEGTYVCYPMITIVEANRSIRDERLQEIVLFDQAEATMGLGQVNFRKTSSFCGQGNFVNGININRDRPFKVLKTNRGMLICDYTPIEMENKMKVKGNITPGAHICCAGEWCYGTTADNMYAAIGIAVPDDKKNAILFMECIGKTISITKAILIEEVIESCVRIGMNQGINYKEIYVTAMEKTIEKDLGCAMVAIPYFLKE